MDHSGRGYSHIYKRASSRDLIVPRYRQDAGELRDLSREIVIMDEICHLRWHLVLLLQSLSPSVIFTFYFLYSFFNVLLRIA